MSAGLRVFQSGAQRPLDVAGIEADLAALWEEASSAGKKPAIRASRTNLVALLCGANPEKSGQQRVESLIPAIARIYASRALVVRTGAGGEPGTLTASVSALCALGGEAQYVCCERISLEVAPGAEAAVPGAVLSLLLGELPVVVWIPGELPLAAHWFRSMVGSADRLLIDSSLLSVPSATFRALHHLTGSFRRIDIADFEWQRLVPWRRAIHDAFDGAEAREAAREGLDRVTFFETRARGGTAGSPGHVKQTILADESPAESTASAGSLLLRFWIARRVHTRSFAWASPETARGPASSPATATARTESAGAAADGAATAGTAAVAAEEDPSRGIFSIRFEGRRAGMPFRMDVASPTHARPPLPDDFARLLRGQSENPLIPPAAARGVH